MIYKYNMWGKTVTQFNDAAGLSRQAFAIEYVSEEELDVNFAVSSEYFQSGACRRAVIPVKYGMTIRTQFPITDYKTLQFGEHFAEAFHFLHPGMDLVPTRNALGRH